MMLMHLHTLNRQMLCNIKLHEITFDNNEKHMLFLLSIFVMYSFIMALYAFHQKLNKKALRQQKFEKCLPSFQSKTRYHPYNTTHPTHPTNPVPVQCQQHVETICHFLGFPPHTLLQVCWNGVLCNQMQ